MMTTLGKEVPLGKLAKELKSLWADDAARTNACMMNLAVFTEDSSALEENFKRISALTENHSCRALSIALDRSAPEESITSWLTAHCNMSNGKKTVCCEQISFLLKGYRQGRMRNTVFANLNSDLPLVFWWQGQLSEAFEPRLYTLIDRFIFDSAEWDHPRESYGRILTAAEDVQRRFVVQDLAWTRSYYMRLAFAGIFDEATAQEEFPHLREVSLIGNEKTTLFLLLSWLATQAGWTFSGKEEGAVLFTNSEGVEIRCTVEIGGEFPISEIGIASENASFLVKQNAGEDFLHQVISCSSGTHELTSTAGKIDDVSLVADQLSRGGKNSLLRKTLPLFLELID